VAGASPRGGGGDARRHRTRVVLLGTAGGPSILTNDRFGVSTAVVYEDRVYLVDLGHGAHMRLLDAGLGGNLLARSLTRVRGIFFTHLHSDHIVEWPALYATGASNSSGRGPEPIRVFGPGDRGALPRVFPPDRPAPPVFHPADPTPGLAGMSGYLTQAFAADFNDRARDSNFAGPDSLFELNDIDISPYWTVDPEGVPPRLDAPIPIWDHGDVRIQATLVDHHPTAPSFAFRFDTPDGSVVVSGDTNVNENLIDLAQGADVLVHEVIDPEFVDRLVANFPPEQAEPLRQHLLEAHTTIEQVGRDVAEPAGARTLVLTHFVPADNPARRWRRARFGFSGRLVVGEDLMQLGVGRPNR
jgi:ribonuclease BN (tRNA processing enzyme)